MVNIRTEHYSLRVAGSILTGGKLFAEFMMDPAMIWLKMTGYRKTRITNSQDLNMACNKMFLTFFFCFLFSEEGALTPASAAGVRGRDGHDEEHQGIPHTQTSGLQTDNIQTGNTT